MVAATNDVCTYPHYLFFVAFFPLCQDFYNLMNVYLDAVFFPRAVRDPQVTSPPPDVMNASEGCVNIMTCTVYVGDVSLGKLKYISGGV